MGRGQNFLTQIGSGQIFVARVRSGQPFLVWVWIWKISPKNVKFFNFFPHQVKKMSSGWVGLLFTAGQKYVRIGLGPISTKNIIFFIFFLFRVIKNLFEYWVKKYPDKRQGRPLIYCGSKVCSGWV